MKGFTDIHSHFVYGIDDGASNRKEMEAMLDAAYADGIRALVATPHITPALRPFDEELFRTHLDEARQYCASKDYKMTLYSGAEILYTPALESYLNRHPLHALANSNRVLLEFMPSVSYLEIEDAVALLLRAGYKPILAHIERYNCLLHGKRAFKLKEQYDVCYQLNAGTFLAEKGLRLTRFVRKWIDEDLIDHIASDAHDTKKRPFRMKKAYNKLLLEYGKAMADHLTGRRQATK